MLHKKLHLKQKQNLLKTHNKGFSLFELVIVVGILGVLATWMTLSWMGSSTTAKEKADETLINDLMSTYELAAQSNEVYNRAKDIADMQEGAAHGFVLEFKVKPIDANKTEYVLQQTKIRPIHTPLDYEGKAEIQYLTEMENIQRLMNDRVAADMETVKVTSVKYQTMPKCELRIEYPDSSYVVKTRLDIKFLDN